MTDHSASDPWKPAATDPAFGGFDMPKHRNGIPWDEAPLPPFLHRCRAQTKGGIGLTGILRCPCGAAKLYGLHNSRWMDKNQTRIDRSRVLGFAKGWSIGMDVWAVLVAVVLLVMAVYAMLSLIFPDYAGILTAAGIGTSAGLVVAVLISVIARRMRV